MLRIKDDIDLKELKKFGFEENGVNDITYIKQWGHKSFQAHIVASRDKTRMIYISTNDGHGWLPIDDVLFDIIQEGLVEKVE